ncbi:hypothetical protein [Propionispora hippei]|uniref:Uncharacterized protein n=1 Tax=Propionispora hippei DSM 15287 TaxID=1123003 RepID=A0A1M6EN17_9FIRM|nr:hypothetical protein [Propionispora hippei]SHI86650.1 hypothetical protein SAMN02745170_01243 [Propionispora hippei DSM 15287]
MSISSISNNWTYYPHHSRKNSSTSSIADTTATDDSQAQSASSSTDLDDTSIQDLFSGVMSQGLLPVSSSDEDGTDETGSDMAMAMIMPPPPPSMDNTAATPSNEDAISVFLDKGQSGTATGTDVNGIQRVLAQSGNQTGAAQTTSDSTGATDSTLTLQSFLEKVKNGTVTDSDLSALQALLNTAQGQSGMMPPPTPPEQTDSNSVSGARQSQLVNAIQSYENTGTVYGDNSSWSS